MRKLHGVKELNEKHLNSFYLKHRKLLVDWMCEIGDLIKMAQSTIHHSVNIMDLYFSIPEIKVSPCEEGKRKLQLITLTSLFISAKFNEKDSRGPTARDISQITKSKYSEQEIIEMELTILKTVQWDLMMKTPSDYISLFLYQGVVFSDDTVRSSLEHLREV